MVGPTAGLTGAALGVRTVPWAGPPMLSGSAASSLEGLFEFLVRDDLVGLGGQDGRRGGLKDRNRRGATGAAGGTNWTGATLGAAAAVALACASSIMRMRPASSTRLTLATTIRPSTEIGSR